MKNSILLIENNVFNSAKKSLLFEGIIYTKSKENLTDIILFKDSIFSLTLMSNYTLKLKKLYSTLNIYYSEFIDFSINIQNSFGIKKSTLHINSYLLDYLIDSLKNILLEENDTISITSTLYELSKFENTIYNRKPLKKTTVFKVINGELTKITNRFINSKAILQSDFIEVSGLYLRNTPINISYDEKFISLLTDDFGYFNSYLPKLPLGLKLTLTSNEAIASDIKVTHPLSRSSAKSSIKVYSIFNSPCKLSNIVFDLYKRKFKVTSYSNGILANNTTKALFSFTLFNESGDIILRKEFAENTTDTDLINTLNNIELKENFYISLESSCEIFKFASQSKLVSNVLLYVTDKEITRIYNPIISLEFNKLNIKSIYKDSNIFIKIDDTISIYKIESNDFDIYLPKNIKYNTAITAYIESNGVKTLPIVMHSSYKSKNTAFLFNTNIESYISSSHIPKDILISNKIFLTTKYALPFYFFEKGLGRISISSNIETTYTLYLLNNNTLEKLDTFTTNSQNKFSIPSEGIIFIDFNELQTTKDKIKILFKPIDICYRNLYILNNRDHIKESNIIFTDYLHFKNIITTTEGSKDSLVVSKFFSVYIFDNALLQNIDNTFSLFSNIYSNFLENDTTNFKEV